MGCSLGATQAWSTQVWTSLKEGVGALGMRELIPFGLRLALRNWWAGSGAEVVVTGKEFSAPTDYDVIFFPVIAWDYLYQRPQQLVKQFALAGHRVFYIHTAFHKSSRLPFVRDISDRIYGVRLFGPVERNALYSRGISEEILEGCIESLDWLRHRAGISRALCFVQWPLWVSLVVEVCKRWGWKLVYDCLDEHGAVGDPKLVSDERRLFLESDLVVVASSVLKEKAAPLARKLLLLPNAADFEHFSRAGASKPLSFLPRPIIGYYGAVSSWFDVEMVRAAAAARSAWQFVIIGDVFGVDVRPLKRLRNVHMIKRQPYELLPSYLHQFDVACIPFVIGPVACAANPVKFYEYLSAGKPVVATCLPELEPYSDYFYLARSAEEFILQVEVALEEQSDRIVRARRELARRNTWQHRFDELRSGVGAVLNM
jgi:glycosyltransferase involved in cell wall biosynthesis